MKIHNPDLAPVNNDNRHNCPELDYNTEHIHEALREIHCDEFLQKNQMAGTADGKPFRDSFHNTVKNRFQKFYHSITPLFLLFYDAYLFGYSAATNLRKESRERITFSESIQYSIRKYPSKPNQSLGTSIKS